MNAKELIKTLEEVIDDYFDSSLHEFLEIYELNEKVVSESENDGDREAFKKLGEVDHILDERVKPDTWSHVYHFKTHNIYLRIDGYYSSWNGTEYDNDWYEVVPEQVTVTKYRRVK